LVENGDQQFWKERFHATNGKAQHAFIMAFVFSFWGGVGGVIFGFFPCSQCAPNMFSSCSLEVLQVPKLFLKAFFNFFVKINIVFSIYIHMFLYYEF
jgi:uncharacterized membrane protein YesL